MGVTQQPRQLSKLDRGNPITRGIIDAVIPSNYVTVSGVQAVFSTNANTTYQSRPQGQSMVIASSTTTDFQSYGPTTGPLVIQGPLTILSFYRLTATPAGAQRIAGTQTSGGAAGYAIAPNGTNFRFLTGNGGARTAVGSAVTTSPKIDVGTIDAAGVMNFYENGELTATVSTGSNSAAGSTGFKVGTAGTTDNAARAEHFLHVVWNRVLTQAEITALAVNPWQIFQSPRRVLFAPPAAVGGAIIANPIRGAFSPTRGYFS